MVTNTLRGLPGTFSGESGGQGAEQKIGEKISNFHLLRKPLQVSQSVVASLLRSINLRPWRSLNNISRNISNRLLLIFTGQG